MQNTDCFAFIGCSILIALPLFDAAYVLLCLYLKEHPDCFAFIGCSILIALSLFDAAYVLLCLYLMQLSDCFALRSVSLKTSQYDRETVHIENFDLPKGFEGSTSISSCMFHITVLSI